ncbi:hypothetical protein BDV27DRAFT_121566 [Aspergillus caelatus]|uniref:Uncharacterized protein n=1 Tax=Aspergillus caelatus TaxID=61420 RepID=A0A5N7AG94_9EURO|nr:uncharacterized protein BDV27DRAFT_121566 [Aspergillus caelatus]KAE8368901.1 hypothetical protein BDV27DRAFT_121566 [Aspergillus caelatus]
MDRGNIGNVDTASVGKAWVSLRSQSFVAVLGHYIAHICFQFFRELDALFRKMDDY